MPETIFWLYVLAANGFKLGDKILQPDLNVGIIFNVQVVWRLKMENSVDTKNKNVIKIDAYLCLNCDKIFKTQEAAEYCCNKVCIYCDKDISNKINQLPICRPCRLIRGII